MIKTEKKRVKNTAAKGADLKAWIYHLRTDKLKKRFMNRRSLDKEWKNNKRNWKDKIFLILIIFIANWLLLEILYRKRITPELSSQLIYLNLSQNQPFLIQFFPIHFKYLSLLKSKNLVIRDSSGSRLSSKLFISRWVQLMDFIVFATHRKVFASFCSGPLSLSSKLFALLMFSWIHEAISVWTVFALATFDFKNFSHESKVFAFIATFMSGTYFFSFQSLQAMSWESIRLSFRTLSGFERHFYGDCCKS
jgi:hypothetical protein